MINMFSLKSPLRRTQNEGTSNGTQPINRLVAAPVAMHRKQGSRLSTKWSPPQRGRPSAAPEARLGEHLRRRRNIATTGEARFRGSNAAHQPEMVAKMPLAGLSFAGHPADRRRGPLASGYCPPVKAHGNEGKSAALLMATGATGGCVGSGRTKVVTTFSPSP